MTCCATKKGEMLVQTPIEGRNLPEHSPTNLIILYDSAVGKAPLVKAIKDCGANIIYDYNIITGMAIRKSDKMTLEESIRYFRNVKGVVSVERDYIHRLTDPVKPRLMDK